MTQPNLLRINHLDNVAVALAGEMTGHKFAIENIAQGEKVIKYGMPIGYAKCNILKDEHVHTHNLATLLEGHCDYKYKPLEIKTKKSDSANTFMGFRRKNSSAGIRNDIWIIPTVGCVNSLARNLAGIFNADHGASGIRALALEHPYGCSQLGNDHERTAQILADFCRHPNAGGVLVLALGCENNTLESFKERLGGTDTLNIRFMRAQDANDEYTEGAALLENLYSEAKKCQRTPISVSELKIGLKCGGSDGFSGITANPLAGRVSDIITSQGGTSVLTEVPEMFGAETLLMERCRNRDVFDKCVKLINDFKDYFTAHNQVVYENPSPGNKAGGITTLEEKSLGCTQKGGLSEVTDVKEYGEIITEKGLNLLSGPGNDMVASTVLAAAGCQIILFTTGRGTPFGTVVPTLKIATNSTLAAKKSNWIDFDAGILINGTDMDSAANQLFQLVLDTASGINIAKNEKYHFQEIAIFKDGVTL